MTDDDRGIGVPDTWLRGLAVLTGLALVAVITIGAVVGSEAAAGDLQPRVEQALVAAGLDGVEVEMAGREVTLSRGSSADLVEAAAIVEAVHGVRWARIATRRTGGGDAGPVRPAGDVPTIELVRAGDRIEVSGVVSDPEESAEIKARASEAMGVPVVGDLVVDAGVGPARWVDALPDLFVSLDAVDGLEIQIDGSGTVVVGGRVDSEVERSEISTRVAEALTDLDVDDALVVDRRS